MTETKIIKKINRLSNRLKNEAIVKFRHFPLNFQTVPPLVKPIFLVGTMRGGTTIIAKCLASHPNVCYPTLSHFELSPEWVDLAKIEIAAPITKMHNCPPLYRNDVTDEIAHRVREGFAKLLLVEGGNQKTRFFNKSPHLWNKLPFVNAIFPDASLLIVSRDLQSTVASLKLFLSKQEKDSGTKHYLPPEPEQCWNCIHSNSLSRENQVNSERVFPGGDISVLAEYWLRVYKTIEENADRFKTVLPIKHRDFTQDPQRTIAKMHESLNLEDRVYELPTILKSRNERWRNTLTTQEQKTIEKFIADNYDDIKSLKYADATTMID
jgi:hypothetical protein